MLLQIFIENFRYNLKYLLKIFCKDTTNNPNTQVFRQKNAKKLSFSLHTRTSRPFGSY